MVKLGYTLIDSGDNYFLVTFIKKENEQTNQLTVDANDSGGSGELLPTTTHNSCHRVDA